jgi:hypothetical protein
LIKGLDEFSTCAFDRIYFVLVLSSWYVRSEGVLIVVDVRGKILKSAQAKGGPHGLDGDGSFLTVGCIEERISL